MSVYYCLVRNVYDSKSWFHTAVWPVTSTTAVYKRREHSEDPHVNRSTGRFTTSSQRSLSWIGLSPVSESRSDCQTWTKTFDIWPLDQYTTMSSAIRRKLWKSTSQHYIIYMLPCPPPPFTSCLSTSSNQATERRRRRFDEMSGASELLMAYLRRVVRHSDDNDNRRTLWRQKNVCAMCCRLLRGWCWHIQSYSSLMALDPTFVLSKLTIPYIRDRCYSRSTTYSTVENQHNVVHDRRHVPRHLDIVDLSYAPPRSDHWRQLLLFGYSYKASCVGLA